MNFVLSAQKEGHVVMTERMVNHSAKSSEPRMLPWGTPAVTGSQFDRCPSTETHWLLRISQTSLKKIQRLSVIPQSHSLDNSHVKGFTNIMIISTQGCLSCVFPPFVVKLSIGLLFFSFLVNCFNLSSVFSVTTLSYKYQVIKYYGEHTCRRTRLVLLHVWLLILADL